MCTGHSGNAEIRAFAQSNGHDVPVRGRIHQRGIPGLRRDAI
ncbi:Lsr2 family DNA-binding protein [Terrabacter terrigena]